MAETVTVLHFAEPLWLWGLVLLVPVALWLMFSSHAVSDVRLRRYADPELLPHLIHSREPEPRKRWLRFAQWALLWLLVVVAMAGPRWDFTDVQLFNPGSNLVILFDISRSMEVADVRPSRLARARQELEDLLDQNRGTRIGLIAFASVSHVVAPITEDTAGIRRLLPALVPELVRLQGSRLSAALERAEQLLASQPAESGRSILLISDGDFVETGIEEQLRRLTAKGIRVHVLGVGTAEGGSVPAGNGRWMQDRNGRPVVSRLNEAYLREISDIGGGTYQRADFRDRDTRDILAEVEDYSSAKAIGKGHTRVWHERFYWLVGLGLLLLLPWFRRSATGRVRGTV
jgi:Ca-activated chloride channel family protein